MRLIRNMVPLVPSQRRRSATPPSPPNFLGREMMGTEMNKTHPSDRRRAGTLVFVATAQAAGRTPGVELLRIEVGVTSPALLQFAGAGA